MQNHRPVMLDEAITGLSLRAAGTYLDGTFGRGGHSAAILAHLSPAGRLHAFDRDPAAAGAAGDLAARHPNFRFHAAPFATLGAVCAAEGIAGRVDGVLLDLGVSSPQFDDPSRGFSFSNDGPLDMRMDPRSGESAADFLARAGEKEIADVLWTLGEERNSRAIARAIVARRQQQPLARTAELAELVLSVHRGPRQRIHPATRSFQALRLHVNQELAQLSEALVQAVDVLAPGGRLVVISFHSLEDRIVKRFMREGARGDRPALALVGTKQFPGADEVAGNPRARSAVLRVAAKAVPGAA